MALGPACSISDKSTRDDIYITEQLNARPFAPLLDAERERRAILELAAAMADRPSEILPDFVGLAMELTGADSAGLSIYEGEYGDKVFRWQHLHGLLSPFENATTPRDDSPCGVTLDENRPVLCAHPERIYDWVSAHGVILPEVLLVPLYVGSDAPLGTLWVVAPQEGHFHAGHAQTLTELAGFAGSALKMIRAEADLRQALEEQEILAREMSHRLKNLFAMTDGIIRSSARSAESVDDMAEALSGRLHALSDAHALVRRQASTLGSGDRSIHLGDLIAAIVDVHATDGTGASRFTLAGPPVACGDRAINTVALVFHELATNAAKYGALSVEQGTISVRWEVEGERLLLDWRECGGPPLDGSPGHEGFGTTLISRSVERHFSGVVRYDWGRDGLSIGITASIAKLAS